MMFVESECITDILNEIGWDGGISIPMANQENKLLFKRLSDIQKSNALKNNEISTIAEKIRLLEEHKINVRIERNNCESIILVTEHNTETEKHLCHLAERELGRLKQDIVTIKKKVVQLTERTHYYENQNYKKTLELDDIKTSMQLDQRSMETYLAECNHQQDLAKYLKLYTREDHSKTAVINHELSSLTDKRIKLRKQLDEKVIETKILQIELDKTAEQYRQEHVYREEVLEMWKYTINQLQFRDKDIRKTSEDIACHRVKLRDLEIELEEKNKLVKTIETNNTEQEKELGKLDREIAMLKTDYQQRQNSIESIKRECDLISTTIWRIGKDTEMARSIVKKLRAKRQIENQKLSKLADQVKNTTKRYQAIQAASHNSDEVLTHVEDALTEEQMYKDTLNRETQKLRDRQYKLNQKYIFHSEDLKNRQASIYTCSVNLKNILKKKNKCEEELNKMDELLYTTEMSIQNWEHRISLLEVDTTNINLQKELRTKIEFLTAELTDVEISVRQLKDMIKRFDNESSLLRMHIDKQKKLKTHEHDKFLAEELSIETSMRMLKKIKKSREEELVFKNLEKLQLKRLEARCQNIKNQVTDLEIQKANLDAITNNRRTEIKYYKDMLRKNLIMVEKEKSDAYKQMQELDGKLKKTITKYQVISNDKSIDEMAGLKHTIETAVMREEMQRYGDQLDLKIRQCQKEIHALENTVVLLNTSNESFRRNLTKANPYNEEENKKWKKVQTKLNNKQKVLDDSRFQLRLLLKDIQFKKEKWEKSKQESNQMTHKLESMQLYNKNLSEKIQALKCKIKRANIEYNNLITKIQPSANELTNIQIAVQNDLNDLFTSEICSILNKKHPNIWFKSGIHYFEKFNIPIPLQWRNTNNSVNNRTQIISGSTKNIPTPNSNTNRNGSNISRSSVSSTNTYASSNNNKATASVTILDLSATATFPLDKSQAASSISGTKTSSRMSGISSSLSSTYTSNHGSGKSKINKKNLKK